MHILFYVFCFLPTPNLNLSECLYLKGSHVLNTYLKTYLNIYLNIYLDIYLNTYLITNLVLSYLVKNPVRC